MELQAKVAVASLDQAFEDVIAKMFDALIDENESEFYRLNASAEFDFRMHMRRMTRGHDVARG